MRYVTYCLYITKIANTDLSNTRKVSVFVILPLYRRHNAVCYCLYNAKIKNTDLSNMQKVLVFTILALY